MHDILRIHKFQHMGAIRALLFFGLANISLIGHSQAQSVYPLYIKGSAFDRFMGTVTSAPNTTTIDFGSNGTPLATTNPNLGNPANTVGNMTVEGTGKTASEGSKIEVKGQAKVPIGNTGKTVPVNVAGKITAAGFARGIVMGARVATPIGTAVAAGALLDYLSNDLKLQNVRHGPQGLEADNPGANPSGGLCGGQLPAEWANAYWSNSYFGQHPEMGYTKGAFRIVDEGTSAKCIQEINKPGGGLFDYGVTSFTCPPLSTRVGATCSGGVTTPPLLDEAGIKEAIRANYHAQTWDQAQAQRAAAALAQGLRYGNVETETERPKVTGPASVPGEKTTTRTSTQTQVQTQTSTGTQTQPATQTKTETKTATHNNTYNDNRVTTNTTYVTTVTTTITNNITNETTTQPEETTTQEPTENPDEEKQEECKYATDRVGCMKVDTPEGEIPKKNKEVTYQAETWGGSGSCPASVVLWERGGNRAFLPIEDICPYLATYVRSLIIALSLFSAFLIVLPGETRV